MSWGRESLHTANFRQWPAAYSLLRLKFDFLLFQFAQLWSFSWYKCQTELNSIDQLGYGYVAKHNQDTTVFQQRAAVFTSATFICIPEKQFWINAVTIKSSAAAEIARVGSHLAFKVTDFGTNRKPVGVLCDFILVINTNLHPLSHHLQVIADYWSTLCLWQGIGGIGLPFFNTLVSGELLNSQLQNLSSRKQKHCSITWCKMCFCIWKRLDRIHECDKQTDRQTEMSLANSAV